MTDELPIDPAAAPAPSAEPQSPPRPRWLKVFALCAATAGLLYGMVVIDVVLRARHAYQEGEKYMRWNGHPEEKKAELEAEFDRQKAGLDAEKASGKLDDSAYARELQLLHFDLDFKMKESSLKYAFVWYRTAYEMFSPPESRWVRLSREKAAAAKEMWKAELRGRNVRFEDYMLD